MTFFLLPAPAYAGICTAFVGITPYPSINGALSAVGAGPGAISVTGTCSENVQINNARSITIQGFGGATVVEPTDLDAFDISQSQGITISNFDISSTGVDGIGVNITEASDVHLLNCIIHNNQAAGVNVDTASVLLLHDSIIQYNTPFDGLDVYDSIATVTRTTIQNNGSPGANGGVGVFVSRTSVVAFAQQNFILNNADVGIQAANLSSVFFQSGNPLHFTTVQGHNTNGIYLAKQSHFQINGPAPHVIQGNGATCPTDPMCGGIFATTNSTVQLNAPATISGNHGSGISAQEGSNVRLNGATVSNNTGDGVHLRWISIGDFVPGSGTAITGNGGASISCDERSLAVGDLSGFSKVKCDQDEKDNEHGHSDEGKGRHR